MIKVLGKIWLTLMLLWVVVCLIGLGVDAANLWTPELDMYFLWFSAVVWGPIATLGFGSIIKSIWEF